MLDAALKALPNIVTPGPDCERRRMVYKLPRPALQTVCLSRNVKGETAGRGDARHSPDAGLNVSVRVVKFGDANRMTDSSKHPEDGSSK
jgi:hypothetical protein